MAKAARPVINPIYGLLDLLTTLELGLETTPKQMSSSGKKNVKSKSSAKKGGKKKKKKKSNKKRENVSADDGEAMTSSSRKRMGLDKALKSDALYRQLSE